MDPSFSSSPAPYPAGGTLGLLQVSCPSLEVGGGSPHPAFQAAAVSPPSNPTCTALLPSCGTQSSLDWHWPPQSWASFTAQPAPREEPPALALGHSVTCFAFYTYSPFLSTVPSLLWRKSKPHFLCVFLSDPLFSSNLQSSCWDQVPKPMECHSHQQVHWNRPLCHLTVYFLLAEPPLRCHTMVYACLLCLNTTRYG